LHSPELLVLDEPTTGVDPVSRAEMWRLITGAAAQGTTAVVTTTYVNEAARADAVVLLESGQVLVSGSPEEVLRHVPGTLGAIPAGRETGGRPGIRSWRRGAGWRVWAQAGSLPDGVQPVQPDFDDAVVIAALADEAEVSSADTQREELSSGEEANAATERGASPQGEQDGSLRGVREAGPQAILAEARSASRRFRAVTAVCEASLEVGRGEVVGLLGGNGAGKTTLIRLLLGLLRPSSGVVRLLGSPPSTETRRRVGYVPQTLGLYAGLTVAENWEFHAAAFGSRSAQMPERIAMWRRQLVGGLPLGPQRQVAFAVALSHQPELLILDEPTSGVGPLGRARLWEEIRQAAERGAGVLVTTHGMDEAQQCDRLVVMADGRVETAGSTADIIGDRTVTEVRCDDPRRAFAVLDAAGLPVQAYGSVLRVGAAPSAITGLLCRAGIEPSTTIVPAGLEEAFVALIASRGPAPNRSEASRAS
jgi:ABC-2 type transport system ATP-binding protein